MSRSRRKTPICGVACAQSDKFFKKLKARKRRRSEDPIQKKDHWRSAKDGKQYFAGAKNEARFRRK